MREERHDPYRSDKKLPEPTLCPDCRAVYREGRWQWTEDSQALSGAPCPACQRIRDKYPAGFVTLTGAFLLENRDEISRLARNIESREKAAHPLNRIMEIETSAEGLLVTTTDMHLARAIGDAVHRAYGGELDYHYEKDSSILRLAWSR